MECASEIEVILQLFRGEAVDAVSREIQVTAARGQDLVTGVSVLGQDGRINEIRFRPARPPTAVDRLWIEGVHGEAGLEQAMDGEAVTEFDHTRDLWWRWRERDSPNRLALEADLL